MSGAWPGIWAEERVARSRERTNGNGTYILGELEIALALNAKYWGLLNLESPSALRPQRQSPASYTYIYALRGRI